MRIGGLSISTVEGNETERTQFLFALATFVDIASSYLDEELDMSEKDWLDEQIKTIRNLCDIAMLVKVAGKTELLPTVLELMYLQCQRLIDENCLVRDETNVE